jgi:endonuclease-3
VQEFALRQKVRRVVERLREAYGSRQPRFDLHPTDELIATILSQHTSDVNSHRTFRDLKARFPGWREVVEADTAELAETIRSAGLGNIKAERIQSALREIERRFGTMDLGFLKDLPLDQAREALRGVPGIGPKTSACVLMFSCGLPALPVDTHVHRVALRLGLIRAGTSADRAHDELERLVPAADVYDFHVNLIAHGRRVCMARRPRCQDCSLRDLCVYYAESASAGRW